MKNRAQVGILVMLLCFSLTGCGYHWGRGELVQNYSTLCVPYVEGDRKGHFTAHLIHELNSRGALAYRSSGADLLLKVCLIDPIDTNIGFIYATNEEGEVSKIVVPNEARIVMGARFQLIERQTGSCILGPIEVRSAIEYDYESDFSHINEHAFSLGQLEMHNLAQEAAYRPLFVILAGKIVDYINNGW